MNNFEYLQNVVNNSGVSFGNKSDDIRFYKLPPAKSTTVVRVLPFNINNSEFPFKAVLKHYNIPNATKGITCLKTWMMECPICDVLNRLSNKIDTKLYSAVLRPACNALILRDITNANINPMLPHVLTITPQLLQVFSAFWLEQSKRSIFDVINGRNVTLVRVKDKGSFNLTFDFENSPIALNEPDIGAIMSNIYNLENIWKSPDDNGVNNVMSLASTLEEAIMTRMSLLSNGVDFDTQQPRQQFNQQQNQVPRQQFNQGQNSQYQRPIQNQMPVQQPTQQFNQQPIQNQVPRQQFNPIQNQMPVQQPVQNQVPRQQQPTQQFSQNQVQWAQQQQQPQQPIQQQPTQQFSQRPIQQPTQQQQQRQQPIPDQVQWQQQFNQDPMRQITKQMPVQQYDAVDEFNSFEGNSDIRVEYVTDEPSNINTEVEFNEVVGSPECFGNLNVYNRDSSKCISCNFEFQCEKSIAAKKV